jgi:ABC-type Na+ efflux pump permease subunit
MAFALFAMYLMSFNLFITSTAEEREKRVLLGLLLSPASATEVLTAKVLFYATGSVVVTAAVIGMYKWALLLQPLLWLTVISGSVCYVAIGTVVVSIVRRQSTINTISMLYLVITLSIMLLSEFIPIFTVVHWFLIENYLYAQMKRLVAGQWEDWMAFTQIALVMGTIAWCVAALWIFSRKVTSIAQAR